MNTYITSATIKRLRQEKGLTQTELADQIGVSCKAISKWETARGLPDITLLEPLAKVLGVSVVELTSGKQVKNSNISANLLRSKFYVCPICGNALHATGNALVSCCGVTLPPLEAEEMDEAHFLSIEEVEDEHFLSVHHDMTKAHYISFLAFVTADKLDFIKLYPEGNAEARLRLRGRGYLYLYCNKHGLFKRKI